MSSLMIYEVFGGAGNHFNASSAYNADYVVLYNAGSSAVSLTGFGLQVRNGGNSSVWSSVALSGSVEAYSFFLVQVSANAATGTAPTADLSFASTPLDIGPTNGRVALTNTTDTLAADAPATSGTVVDFVGWGNAVTFEGAAAPGTGGGPGVPNVLLSIQRNAAGGWDTNNNSADFSAQTPQAKNSSSAPDSASAPSFNSSNSGSIAENSTSTILQVSANDPGSQPLTYSIVSSAEGGAANGELFVIDASTGALHLISGADFETASTYSVTVRAMDTGRSSVDQTITVSITDVNEAPTSFSASNVQTLAENTAVETIVADLTLIDPDTSAPFNSYTFSVSDNRFGVVEGKLVLLAGQTVDFETEPSISVTVTATNTDNASHSLTTAPIVITVTNVNESNLSAVTDADIAANVIGENSTGAVHITALATDSGGNFVITYGLTGDISGNSSYSGPFSIDTDTGVVSLTGPLDYETVGASTDLFVKAMSTGGSISVVQFTVTITDVNDAPTSFGGANLQGLAENTSTQTIVADLVLADPDTNPAFRTYSYAVSDDRFSVVDGKLVLLAGQTVDYEQEHTISLTVTAKDTDGAAYAITSTPIVLTVTDVDEFDVGAVTDTDASPNHIAENATGLVGLTAHASDADGSNNTVTYSLVANQAGGAYTGPFSIDAITGAVTLNTALDFETAGPSVTLFIKATSSDLSTAIQGFTVSIDNVSPELMNGNAAANTLIGGSDADKIFGFAGNDILIGGAGNDTLTGGLGRDQLTGGNGADDFDYNAIAEIGNGAARDIIRDFQYLADDIDLSTIDANGMAAGNGAFHLRAFGAAFSGAKGELRWYWSNPLGTANDRTIIEGDINGDKRADFQIELVGLKVLTSADFIL